MTNGSKLDFMAIARREWLVVLVPAIVCLVIAGFMARVAPSTHWVASERYLVQSFPNTVAAGIKPDALIAALGTPRTLRSAEASLGLPAGALNGTVASVIDKGDQNAVVINVTAPSQAEAVRRANIVGLVAKAQTLTPYQIFVTSQAKQVDYLNTEVAAVRKQIALLTAQAAAAPATDRGSYAVARANLEGLVIAYGQSALANQQAVDYVDKAVTRVQDPVAKQVTTGGVKTSTVLEGLLVGLVIGVAAAIVREWLLRRSAAA